MRVTELTDASEALERAGAFLTARSVENNLLLTIIDQSIELDLGGTFWLVEDVSEDEGSEQEGSLIVGFALESPPGFGAVLARMPVPACRLLAESISTALPHVIGEAGTVAAFAGHWTECHSTSVTEIEGQRFYALTAVQSVANASGSMRLATSDDRATLVEWAHAFIEEVDIVPQDTGELVDARLATDRFWVWEDDEVVSMVSASEPVAGVARVQYVYTPPARRGAGYATACVEQLSRLLTERGLRCVLFTDLENATSNAIYRRIGYEAVAEILGYGFAGSSGGG